MTKRLLAVVLVAAVLTLAGCSSTGRNESGKPMSGGAAQDDKAAAAPGADAKPPAQGAPAPAEYRREDRSIVYTGEITVRVKDVTKAAADATALADGAGGFVAADKRARNDETDEAHLTLRIPAARFVSTVDKLAALGEPESRAITTEDVTQQVVDLDAQIASQKASVDRTRALLARAQSVGEIVSIEAELAKRESALATLEARKRRLDDLTTLSTVTVHVLEQGARSVQDNPFVAGLKTGVAGFVGAMGVLLAILGFLLPFLLVLGLPGGLVWWLIRRRRVNPPSARPDPSPLP